MFYYYHYHLRYHYRCHHCYHHHLMLCAIGLYMYCRRRSRNDCVTFTITIYHTYAFIHEWNEPYVHLPSQTN